MKTAKTKGSHDGMKSEYDFAHMKGGVRGKYAAQYRAGTNLVLLDPEIAAAFPTSESVNQALRAALHLAEVVPAKKRRAQ